MGTSKASPLLCGRLFLSVCPLLLQQAPPTTFSPSLPRTEKPGSLQMAVSTPSQHIKHPGPVQGLFSHARLHKTRGGGAGRRRKPQPCSHRGSTRLVTGWKIPPAFQAPGIRGAADPGKAGLLAPGAWRLGPGQADHQGGARVGERRGRPGPREALLLHATQGADHRWAAGADRGDRAQLGYTFRRQRPYRSLFGERCNALL